MDLYEFTLYMIFTQLSFLWFTLKNENLGLKMKVLKFLEIEPIYRQYRKCRFPIFLGIDCSRCRQKFSKNIEIEFLLFLAKRKFLDSNFSNSNFTNRKFNNFRDWNFGAEWVNPGQISPSPMGCRNSCRTLSWQSSDNNQTISSIMQSNISTI